MRRETDAEDTAEVARCLAKYMPAANGPLRKASTCLYTMTPDNHFVLDRHPAIPGWVYGCRLSGHGFKFAPVIGEAPVDIALRRATDLPVGFLAAGRFATEARAPAP